MATPRWLTYGGHVDREGAFACMKAAYDSDVNFFDCAEVYAEGESERVMGEAIKKFGWKRNDLVIATKLHRRTANSDKKINNLSYVGLVFAHRPDRRTPMEEAVRAFNHLINTGKALCWGTSEWSPDEIAQAWSGHQARYNMLECHKVEHDFAHLYREHGLGLTAFSSLRQGILTVKYKNGIPEDPRLAQTKVEFPIAEKLGVKQSVLTLAWVLANPNVSSAITGASSPEQIYENIEAIAVYKRLTPGILSEIDEILNNKPPVVVPRF
ncbi:NADP-dependent oxidoreductase domain-containing protein [Immersiella caudata]|uniref:NADP-dependent oxidoreductase domain-containing protein n=1 Tax=Immersiella caudata TaxID=314043 RepID=A0AA39WPM4_9PEZI|nr:NADP-dependent oxidoreductase domain-containing protein [Immersiella caudata]